MNKYTEYLSTKNRLIAPSGFTYPREQLNPMLFDYQKDIVKWALYRGRSAIFAMTGLGKTLMQLEWAQKVVDHTGKDVLILAPLAVSSQTIEIGQKMGISVKYAHNQSEVQAVKNIALVANRTTLL